MTYIHNARTAAAGAARGGMALLAVAVLSLAGCDIDRLVTVENPTIVTPEDLDNPQALPNILAGAVGQFAVAYSGSSGTEGQILTSGLFTDEFILSGTFPTRLEVDRRNVDETNATTQAVFRVLSEARVSAERTVEAFVRHDEGAVGHAEASSLAGFTYVLFAENYCSGVPFSRANPDGTFEFGEPLSTNEILTRALERFDASLTIAQAVESASMEHLAAVGRGRALLNRGDFEAAAAAVADVPTDFEYNIVHSENTGRENNGVFVFNHVVGRWSVANNEGINGLPWRTADDPRAPNRDAGRAGFDRRTRLWLQLKYPNRSAPVPLATGIEARLIEAEAHLRADRIPQFLTTHNELRSELMPELGTLVPAAGEDLVSLHFRERAFWLWLTSHRLGDLRRMVRQYGFDSEEVFPTGAHFKGGLYGPQVSLPVPIDEHNNPNFGEGDCDPTQA